MSDQIEMPVNETSGSGSQFMQSYQSVWMSHWKRTNCNTAIQTHNRCSSVVRNMELDYSAGEYNSPNGLKVSRSVKGHGEIETKTFEIINESLRMSLESLRNEGLEFSSLFKHGQDTNDLRALKPVYGHNSDCGKVVYSKPGIHFTSLFPGISAANEISSRGGHCLDEGTSKNSSEWMRPHSSAKDSTFAASKPLQDTFVKSSSHAVPYTFERENFEFDKGRMSVPLLIGKFALISDNHLSDANMRILEQTKYKKSLYDCYSLQKVPRCVSDVETMRICTTVDSVVETGGYPRFSQTTHSLLFTKKTDVNLSKESDIFRGTRVLENMPSDLHSPSPFHGQGKLGLKLQSLSSSTDIEVKGNFEFVKTSKVTIKNESSAETDTMHINSFKEKNPMPGAYSSPLNKAINMDWNLPPRMAVASSKQAGCRCPNTELPDINLDLPALPAAVTLSEKAGPISSRTQSLEMDILLAHAEQPKPKSNLCLDVSPIADPHNRWVKRLKLSSSHSSAQGTKSSNMTKYSSHEKMNKFFSKILNSSITSSESTVMRPYGKESPVSVQRRCLSKEDEDFSANATKKGKELLFSHAWIHRWLSNGSCTTQKKSETVMVCEPQNSKFAQEDLQNGQFPSIAAMALVGKAMSVFQPCELQKRGSFTVWNTKAF